MPRLKYGQKRFGSGNLYKRAAQSKACTCNTPIFVNMQAMLKERIKNRLLLWILAGNLVELASNFATSGWFKLPLRGGRCI